MPQIRVLVEEIIPQWFRSSVLPFRVWSAACATGEEPYTIAMAVAEAGLTEQAIEIVGSDASPAALEKAQRGIYREKSFRSLPPLLRSKYFEEVPEGWKLRSEIKGRVKFRRRTCWNRLTWLTWRGCR
jgi:chemotaxis protein methyltransferase CheR